MVHHQDLCYHRSKMIQKKMIVRNKFRFRFFFIIESNTKIEIAIVVHFNNQISFLRNRSVSLDFRLIRIEVEYYFEFVFWQRFFQNLIKFFFLSPN